MKLKLFSRKDLIQKSSASVDLTNTKILLIDDFVEFRRSLKKMIRAFGALDIDDVSDGDEAIEHMSAKAYDIILCDYNLGDDKKDGQQILEEAIHHDLINYSTIFIMVTAETTQFMVMGALEFQPDDYLTKPFNRDVLVHRLERLIEKKSKFKAIDRFIKKKQYLKAIELCNESIKANPKEFIGFLRIKADLFFMLGNYADAMTIYEQVLETHDTPWAKLGLGKVFFFTKNFYEAMDIFEELIDDTSTFLTAYDWMTKTLRELDDLKKAQKILMEAVKKSQKSFLRYKTLGEIALKNQDYNTAETAFRHAIELGKNSCHKSPSDYINLVRVLIEKKNNTASKEAFSLIEKARTEYKDSHEVLLQTSAMEGIIYMGMDKKEESLSAVTDALRLFDKQSTDISVNALLDMAKACFIVGGNDRAEQLLTEIIKNNHQDKEVLSMVRDVFRDSQLKEHGENIISTILKKMVQINNTGIHYIREGSYEEAVNYFEKILAEMPNNKLMISNAASAILMFLKHKSKDDAMLLKCKQYLDRLKEIDSTYLKYQQLLHLYEEFITMRKKNVRDSIRREQEKQS